MNDIQDMIAEGARRLFFDMVQPRGIAAAEAGQWPAALWQAVEDAGYTQVLVPEPDDAAPAPWRNALPLLQAIGHYSVPLPLSENIIATALLTQAGLPVPAGPLTVVQQAADGAGLALRLDGDRLVLEGVAAGVPWARFARAILVAGVVDGRQVLACVATDAPGLVITPGLNIGREPRDQVVFAACRCADFAWCAPSVPARVVALLGALARAVMMAGAAQSVLQQSVQYANERVQFGKPIGKFQAVQQSLAVLAGEVTSAQTAAAAACHAAHPWPSGFDVAVAKVRAGQAAGVAANIGHQVHGAIGFTQEHPLHFSTRRLWSWRAEFGSETVWAAQLGREAITRGGSFFWRDLTHQQAAQDTVSKHDAVKVDADGGRGETAAPAATGVTGGDRGTDAV